MPFALLVSALFRPAESARSQMAMIVDSNSFEPLYADVSFRRVRVLNNATLLQRGTQFFVPVRQVCRALGFRLNVDDSRRIASGFLRNPSEGFTLNASTGAAKSKFARLALGPSDSVVREHEFYLSTEALSRLARLKFAFNDASLEMSIDSDLPLSLTAQALARSSSPMPADTAPIRGALVKTPYALATAPSFDLALGGSVAAGPRGSMPDLEVSGAGYGDLLYQSARYQLTTDSMGSPKALIDLGRVDPGDQLLGPLKASQYDFGLVSLPSTSLVVGPRAGLGASFGNYPVDTFLNMPSTAIEGSATAASEVELYRGNQLVAVQNVGANGRYKFSEVLLENGINRFTVVILSSNGDVQISHRVVVGTAAGPDPGHFQYRITADRPEVSLMGSDGIPSPSYSNLNEEIAEARTGIARGSWVGANAAAFEDRNGEHQSFGAGLDTMQSSILWHAGIEDSDFSGLASELGATTSFGGGQLSIDGVHNLGSRVATNTASGYAAADALKVGWEGFGGSMRSRQSYGFEYLNTVSGVEPSEVDAHWGLDSQRFGCWNEFTVPLNGSTPFGYSELSAPWKGNNFKLDLTYDGSTRGWLRSSLLSDSRMIAAQYAISANVGCSSGLLQLGGTMYRLLGPFAAGLSVTASGQGMKCGFVLSTALSAMNRGPRFARPGFAEMGRIKVHVFLDQDGTGKFHKGNPPLANVAVRMVGKGGVVSTNKGGICELENAAPDEVQTVTLDEDSFSDPSWVSEISGVRAIPRAGAVCVVELPVVETAEIDGSAQVGLSAKEEMTCTALLTNGDHELTSSVDERGGYLFSRVVPGPYVLGLRSSSGKILASRAVVVKSGSYSTGFDLVKP